MSVPAAYDSDAADAEAADDCAAVGVGDSVSGRPDLVVPVERCIPEIEALPLRTADYDYHAVADWVL
jgi:hypothetical protein